MYTCYLVGGIVPIYIPLNKQSSTKVLFYFTLFLTVFSVLPTAVAMVPVVISLASQMEGQKFESRRDLTRSEAVRLFSQDLGGKM